MQLILGDCLEKMKDIPDGSVDAIITDPPYELGFMGKSWDKTGITNRVEMWSECLRVLKPGGYLLAFSGTRTYHRMAVAIEDAGFEVRDMIEWVYGSGFPKSLNIGKAIQKSEGVELEDTGVISPISRPNVSSDLYESGKVGKNFTIKNVTTENAKEWEGWGTALKPAHEPISMARKPLAEKTVAENCLKWGVGGINIDGCRIPTEDKTGREVYQTQSWKNTSTKGVGSVNDDWKQGRFPANLIHDNSEEVRECFPDVKTGSITKDIKGRESNSLGKFNQFTGRHNGDSGNASRFFKSIIYQAKASKSERNKGCEKAPAHNNHPTVKPVALMEYLIKMVSRDNAIVLDPFMGSGTTGVACKKLNRDFIGIELDPTYYEIAVNRISSLEKDNGKIK